MADFAQALDEAVAALLAAGLSAGLEPVDVNPPGILVRADAQVPNLGKLCGTSVLRVSLLLVVPDTRTRTALSDLAKLAARVGPALKAAGLTLTPDDQTFERVVMPDDPTGLPCLRLTAMTPTYTNADERVSR